MMADVSIPTRKYLIDAPTTSRVVVLTPTEQRILALHGRLLGLCIHADRALLPDDVAACTDDLRSLVTEAYPADWADDADAARREAEAAD